MTYAIETIETPSEETFVESESVAQFYQDPEEYADQLLSEDIAYNLATPLVATFTKYKVKKGSVLDLGCGSGTAAKALSPKLSFTAVDTAQPMLEHVVTTLNYKKGYWGRIEDVIPVLHARGERFDWCVALSSLYYVKDPLPLIQQLADMCTTGMVLSLDQITDDFKIKLDKALGVKLPLYDHSALFDDPTTIPDGWVITDTWQGHAWNSPRINTEVQAKVVTLRPVRLNS